MSGVAEIRTVFETIGASKVSAMPDAEVIKHATGALTAIEPVCTAILRVWEPENIETMSELLHALAEIAEVGEARAAVDEIPDHYPCAVCGQANTCGDPPGSDCHS